MPLLFKSGDLVILKSGGPTMTVDTVNTDIFDDDKITGMLCVWFVGEKIRGVRFDHRAVEHAQLVKTSPQEIEGPSQQALGDYKAVLSEMADAMNSPALDSAPPPRQILKNGSPRSPRLSSPAEGPPCPLLKIVSLTAARRFSEAPLRERLYLALDTLAVLAHVRSESRI